MTIRLYPVGKTEPVFDDERYATNIEGSNCYSYAFNHFALNGKRPHKSVPGFITTFVSGKRYPETDWQVCRKDVIQRVIDDGRTASIMYNLGVDTVKEVSGKSVLAKLKKKPEERFRRVVMVIAPEGERKGVPTDFHFYAQRPIAIRDIYKLNLHTYTSNRVDRTPNPYTVAGIDPHTSNIRIKQESDRGNDACAKLLNTQTDPNRRAKTNIALHDRMFPKYMKTFVPQPFWLLDIPLHKQKRSDTNQIVLQKANSLLKEIPAYKSIIIAARDACLANKVPNGHKKIGIWTHKLGWGTRPLNTDGDGKLIFDPIQANKFHGGYNYKVVCGVFDVMVGYGITSPWHDIRKFKEKNSMKVVIP
jgi:hypothetical protein